MIKSMLSKFCLSLFLCLFIATIGAMTCEWLQLSFNYFKITIPLLLITPVFIAPWIEEYGKRMALVRGFPWMFAVVFATTEALMYIGTMLANGVSFETTIIARSLAFMMHLGTMHIQIRFRNAYINHGRMGTNWDTLGYYNAVCAHAMWNATCVACMLSS